MALTVATNTGALMAQAAASSVNKEMETSMERLSTGKRINSAADDAAGVAIASRLDSQIRGLNQAIRNSMDTQNLLDTAEGAHEEVTNLLQRMRELSVQAANDTNTASDRVTIQSEVTQLLAEITRIADQTSFGGINLLDGTFSSKSFQVGAEANQSITVGIDSIATTSLGVQTKSSLVNMATGTSNGIDATADMVLSGKDGSVTIDVSANDTAKTVANLINAHTQNTGVSAKAVTNVKLSGLSATGTVGMTVNGTALSTTTLNDTSDLRDLGAAIHAKAGTTGVVAKIGSSNAELIMTDADGDDIKIGSFDHSSNGNGLIITALDQDEAAISTTLAGRLKDTTFTTSGTGESTAFTVAGQIKLSSHSAFTIVTTGDAAADGLTDGGNTTTADTMVSHNEFFGGDAGSAGDVTETSSMTNIGTADVSTRAGANTAIEAIDAALSKIASARGDLGAISNRLDSTVNNLTSISSNLVASRSNIEDADFAAETTNLAKSQILQQASTAMLAQANASKQNVLSLLQG